MEEIHSEEYLTELIDRYQNLVFSICYKMTNDYFASEDLTQETFLSAYRHSNSFDGVNEKAWICRIASNKSIDYVRNSARRVMPTEDEAIGEQESRVGLPEDAYLEAEVKRELEASCKKLKPPYDEIAYLHFFEEKGPDEIAKVINRNLKTVQTQIYRARGMLRKVYEKGVG